MQLVYGRLIGRIAPGRVGHLQRLPLHNSYQTLQRFNSTTASNRTAHLDLPSLDRKWQKTWQQLRQKQKDVAKDSSPTQKSMYVLPMFPYPSGNLHMGHVRVYTIADVMARFRTLQGNHVLLPMGWDAFGLPAENAAIERGINPAVWTKSNIARMKDQLGAMNGSWDWDNELATCDPEFYKHTQRIFLLLHEKGLAYQAEAEVNYDPVDKTVLANEQVDANGCSWRSGAKVEKRKLKQWFLRISAFREELLQGLDKLAESDAWPERVLAMQKNWLGKSTGALVKFPVMAFNHNVGSHIEVFTTRPDTLFGVQYLALAATHPIVTALAKSDPELQAFLDTLPGLPPDSKVGYQLPHIRAINPLAYHEDTPDEAKGSMPVYVAPYVLGDYGEGAVMGVPGHDVRDNAFWKEHHYDEPIRVVLSASEDESTGAILNEPFVDHGVMTAHSGPFEGKSSVETGKILITMLQEAGMAKSVEKWRLRDWLISRQRYWGTPIPVVHCGSCGPVPVPDEQLPVKLPDVDAHWAERKAGNPLETLDHWVNTSCPKCGGAAKRDTDTMDTFVDSSWYYMRFPDVHNKEAPFSAEKVRQFLPVDLYIGGIEHAILHLLYSRFIYKFLMQSPLVAGHEHSNEVLEPFKRLITQGMVQGKTYTDPANGRFLKPEEVDDSNPSKPVIIATGEQPLVSFEKMSKSKYNGVDPTDFIARYGADATRAHMIFQAAAGDTLNWDEDKISGVTRWLQKLHALVQEVQKLPDGGKQSAKGYLEGRVPQRDSLASAEKAQLDADVAVWREVQKTIEAITAGYEKVYSLNTVVSNLMSLTNLIHNNKRAGSGLVLKEALASLVCMAAPITPAFAEECWSILRPSAGSIFSASFPVTDGTAEALLQARTQNCAVQVNGKLKGVAEIPVAPSDLQGDALDDWVIAEVMKKQVLTGPLAEKVKSAKSVRVVNGGKLVNFVL